VRNLLNKVKKLFGFKSMSQKMEQGNPYLKIDESKTTQEQCERLLLLEHEDHIEIIWDLQMRKDPYAIPYIKRAIFLKPHLAYLTSEEDSTYFKRCLWVLQEIGTVEAINLIEEYTHSDKEELAEQARYRIYRINGGT